MNRTLAALAVVAAIADAGAARANGRYPQANQLVARPGDPSRLALRTTFGVLLSRDAGAHWDWVCESAAGYGGMQDPSLGVTGGGSVMAGTYQGLSVSTSEGCAWSMAGGALDKAFVADVVVSPDAPATSLVVTSTYQGSDGGSTVQSNVLARSTDDARTFAPVGAPIDPSVLLLTVELARGAPGRVYLSGVRSPGTSQVSGVLLVSDDGGAQWTERAIPLVSSTERGVYIAAVDRQSPDRLWARTSGPGATRLLVSDDAGKTWRAIFQGAGALLGFALSDDGAREWVGGPVDGLRAASTADHAFAQTSDVGVECLTAIGAALWACTVPSPTVPFVLGASTDDGRTFTPKLALSDVRGPLACPKGSSVDVCAADWPGLADLLKVPRDAGAADAGPTVTPRAGCSCDAAPASGAGAGAALALAAVALLARRRRPSA